MTCANATYCVRQQELYAASLDDDTTQAPRYVISDSSAVTYNSTQINMTLTMTNSPAISTWSPGDNLLVTFNVYQRGILQVKVSKPDEAISRFRISDYGVGVEWGTLIPQTFLEDGTGDYLLDV